MPTILRIGPWRFFFWAQDRLHEPPHVHVERDDKVAKVWPDPVRLDRAGGFSPSELRDLVRLVVEKEQTLLEAWHAFGN